MGTDVFTKDFVARALAGSMTGGESVVSFSDVTTDSRAVKAGSLFVAIKGDTHNGHDFLAKAIASGARGVMCEKSRAPASSKDVAVYAVSDTLLAIRQLAKAWRSQFSIPVAMVVGSVGKTTTKEMIAAILRGKYAHILKTEASQNGFLGIPITLLNMRASHEVAVIEVGIDDLGAMAQHVDLVAPTVAVCTAIGPEHLENLLTVENAAREELLGLRLTFDRKGQVAINLDDPMIAPIAKELKGKTALTYSLSDKHAGLFAEYHRAGQTLMVHVPGLIPLSLTCPLPGEHQARNLLGAVALARLMKLSAEEIDRGLGTFVQPPGRTQIETMSSGTTVICDFYNANPTSTTAALGLLSEMWRDRGSIGKRWVCLGDMLELGTGEEAFHRQLADVLVQDAPDYIFLYGERMKWLASACTARGMTSKHFPTHEAMAADLSRGVKADDLILIKGSRSMKMSNVWDAIRSTK